MTCLRFVVLSILVALGRRRVSGSRRTARGAVRRRPCRRAGTPVPARAHRRRRDRPDLRRRLRGAGPAREGAHLAPVQCGARRPRHLLRPALRPQPGHARDVRGDPHARRRRRGGDARGDPPLRQALLDQHRAVQQPHGPQVRAGSDARGVPRCGARVGGGRRCVPDPRRGEPGRAARPPGAAVLRRHRRSHPDQQDAGPRRRHAAVERQQPVRRRVDGRPRRLRRAVSA